MNRITSLKISFWAAVMVLSLGHCGDSGALGDQLTLTGTISDWNHDDSYTLDALFANKPMPRLSIGMTSIDAMGNFSIMLPGGSGVASQLSYGAPFSDMGCPGTFQSNPSEVNYGELLLDEYHRTLEIGIIELGYTQVSDSMTHIECRVYYYYFNNDITITGDVTCSDVRYNYNINARAGWNRVILKATSTNIHTQVSVTQEVFTGGLPDGVAWIG